MFTPADSALRSLARHRLVDLRRRVQPELITEEIRSPQPQLCRSSMWLLVGPSWIYDPVKPTCSKAPHRLDVLCIEENWSFQSPAKIHHPTSVRSRNDSPESRVRPLPWSRTSVHKVINCGGCSGGWPPTMTVPPPGGEPPLPTPPRGRIPPSPVSDLTL